MNPDRFDDSEKAALSDVNLVLFYAEELVSQRWFDIPAGPRKRLVKSGYAMPFHYSHRVVFILSEKGVEVIRNNLSPDNKLVVDYPNILL